MNKINILFACLLFALLINGLNVTAQKYYQIPQHATVSDYQQGIVLFKLKEQYRAFEFDLTQLNQLNHVFEAVQMSALKKNFPNAKRVGNAKGLFNKPLEDLSLIFEMEFNPEFSVAQVMHLIQKTGVVEYAQPRFFVQPLFTPNDPQITQQYYLETIKAYEAWDITQGDTNIVIGITDGGIQFDHPDLAANVKYNYDDPINGIDDDGDGYIDNFRGWNFGFNNNDPTASLSPHGIFTTGVSSATVNNDVGIAGVGYKSKYIPIRIDNSQGWSFGYEGIVYAADMGCQIINASWGNTFYAPMNEAVVRFATINRNALVVSAAGNSNLNEKYYPASYEFCINVGGTTQTDVKWVNSTFNTSVDICAPADNIRSTWPFSGYNNSSGTSFATPMVSAAAALLKSYKPQYNALQLGERLKVTSDSSIYQIPANDSLYHKLGFGRLNILRALTDPDKPSIVAGEISLLGTENELLSAGSQVEIRAIFTNYLEPAQNLKITLVSESPFFTVVSEPILISSLATSSSYLNTQNPFVVSIAGNAPFNVATELKFVYEADGYKGYQYFRIDAHKDYMDLTVNNITTTITSKGDIGYNQPFQRFGKGFKWNDSESLLSYSGLMVGVSSEKVSNNAYGSVIPNYDRHFKPVEIVTINTQTDAAKEIDAIFNDDNAISNKLEVLVHQKAFAYNDAEHMDYIIKEFTIKNNGIDSLKNFYAGNFTDWSIMNYTQNVARFIPDANLVYANSTNPDDLLFAGIKILSLDAANAYCLNSDGTAGSISYYDGFSKAEKYQTLTGADARHETVAGDVSTVISSGPFQIASGDSITIAFAMIAGNSVESLIQSGNKALANYLYRNSEFQFSASVETCLGNDAVITIIDEAYDLESIHLLNTNGAIIATELSADEVQFTGLISGAYQLKFNFNDSIFITKSIQIDALDPVSAEIEASALELYLPVANLVLNANAENAENFSWNIGENVTIHGQSIEYTFEDSGTYQITLYAYNADCADTAEITIIVRDTSTSVHTIDIEESLDIFPNPVIDVLNISMKKNFSNAVVEIYNMQGQKLYAEILTKQLNSIEIDHFSKGIYLARIMVDGKVYAKKVVKH